MKPGKVFWGIAFLSAGIFLMLGKLHILNLCIESVWRFWPVIVVLLGVAMLVGRQSLKMWMAGIAGLLLGLLVSSVFCTDWAGHGSSEDVVEQQFTRPYDPSITLARLHIDAGAGTFIIAGSCSTLVDAHTATSIGRYDFRTDAEDSSAEVYVTMEGHKPGWRTGGWENRVEVSLHKTPEWKLDLDIGAAKADLDLRSYRLRSLNLDAGAATVDVRLGALNKDCDVEINAGVSSITLEVPESADCEIHVEAPLSSKKFPGFTRVGEGVYRSETSQGADHRISIRLEGGVSSLKVKRVEG